MAERRTFSIFTNGTGLQIAVGARVSLPTNAQGIGIAIIPDPTGTHVVVAYQADQLKVETVEAADCTGARRPRSTRRSRRPRPDGSWSG